MSAIELLDTSTWTVVTLMQHGPLPHARYGCVAGVIGERLWIIGGCTGEKRERESKREREKEEDKGLMCTFVSFVEYHHIMINFFLPFYASPLFPPTYYTNFSSSLRCPGGFFLLLYLQICEGAIIDGVVSPAHPPMTFPFWWQQREPTPRRW